MSQSASTPHIANPKTLYGILFMLMNAAALAVMYTATKELTQDLSSHLVVFLYKFSILVLILPWCFRNGFKSMKTNRIWVHASRGFLSICGSLSLYYAIKHIELVDITAVGYLEQVILVIIGILYFKEKATVAKIVGITLSFIGALIVVNPDILNLSFIDKVFYAEEMPGINPYYAFVFMSIGFWATNCTVIKILGKTEKTEVQLFYVLLFSCIIAAPMAFMQWETVATVAGLPIRYPAELTGFADLGLKLVHLKYLGILSLCYFIHAIAFFKALKYAELSTVIPFDYSRLIFVGVLGYMFFGETPALGSYIGYALIAFSGVYLIQSEAKRRKKLEAAKIMRLEEEYEHA
jgi:drug/metabolite transporter (DMT)-like permease